MGMTLLWDLLVYYNNCDVVPFLTALDQQCCLYKECGVDMLKVVPSLRSLGMCNEGSGGVFNTFSPEQAELAQLVTHGRWTEHGVLKTSTSWTYPYSLSELWDRCPCLQGCDWV